MPASEDRVDVTIRIDPAQAAAGFDEIVQRLAKAGLVDLQTHPRFGIVNGTVTTSALSAMRKVPGVLSVREDRRYGLSKG
ncbi:hypothetical protein [Ideonella sp. YS5]|uniref:hypothetical protein n=1 Tax=Ideonella sp. YS5 TaxID=3453714 RepID=UPI003EEA89DB